MAHATSRLKNVERCRLWWRANNTLIVSWLSLLGHVYFFDFVNWLWLTIMLWLRWFQGIWDVSSSVVGNYNLTVLIPKSTSNCMTIERRWLRWLTDRSMTKITGWWVTMYVEQQHTVGQTTRIKKVVDFDNEQMINRSTDRGRDWGHWLVD